MAGALSNETSILDERPASLECQGRELLELAEELRRRGCIILGMSVTCISGYRLALAWPPPQQQVLIEHEGH